MPKRKPVLLIDDNEESLIAKMLIASEQIEYLEYHIRKFEESCCGELPSAVAPSIFAPEGLFKGLDGVQRFLTLKKDSPSSLQESKSAYW